MENSRYQTDDFLLDDSFVSWILTGQNEGFWQDFLYKHPEQRTSIEQAKTIILATAELPVVEPSTEQIHQMWHAVEQSMQERPSGRVRKLWEIPSWSYWVAAASIALLLLVRGSWFSSQINQEITYQQLVNESSVVLLEVSNTDLVPKLVQLPDGSTVRLGRASRLSFPKTFQKLAQREVYLSGEAFFEVTRNPAQPFLVYANELVTKVLGTSFTIKAAENDKNVTVDVRTGKVAVFSQHDPERKEKQTSPVIGGLVLTANQHITFTRANQQLTKSLVAQPALLPSVPANTSFDFDETAAPVIFKELEKAYGIEIVFDEELLKNCRLTASLTNEPLFEKIRLICQGLDADYELIDTRIIITAKGCTTP